jgi:hypothetical protein
MAEAGRLPAIEVGKQWRFPAAQNEEWVTTQMGTPVPTTAVVPPAAASQTRELSNDNISLADLLPIDCVQLIQDSHADLLGVMMVITDMRGVLITEPSRPCGFFAAISEQPDALSTVSVAGTTWVKS